MTVILIIAVMTLVLTPLFRLARRKGGGTSTGSGWLGGPASGGGHHGPGHHGGGHHGGGHHGGGQ